jgi:penicillin-binding protein 2
MIFIAGCFLMSRLQRQKRIVFFLMFFLLLGFALLGRVFYLQVLHGPRYAQTNVNQRSLRYDYNPFGRGQILDRDGQSLLDTRWVDVHVLFEPLLEADTQAILARHVPEGAKRQVHVFPTNSRLVRELGAAHREGVVPAVNELRYGPNSLAAHVTGYIQKSQASEPTGLEKTFYDELSTGRPFTLAAFVDAHGNMLHGLGIRDLRNQDSRRPYSIKTTIDSSMQASVEATLTKANISSAVVIMDPKNGDILTMASYPWIAPVDIYSGVSNERMNTWNNDPGSPFLNKAIQQYPPGSVFKVILVAAALEEGIIRPDDHFTCTGSYEVGDKTISCYEGNVHGELNMQQALAVSCNSYFVWLGQKLGRQTVTDTAKKFKLGQLTDLPLDEKPGLIPAPEDMPNLGHLANTSIGQGDVLTTPLQLTRVMSIIANDGLDVYPRLVTEVIDNNGLAMQRFPSYKGSRVISPTAARRLQTMLSAVVDSGTGTHAQSTLYNAVGKTGTAKSGPDDYHHSWFSAIIELNGRTLTATVFIQDSKDGRATQLFKKIMESL